MVGDRIKARREALEMTQDELAKRLGYKSRSSINKMELNIQDVPQRKIKEMADVLKTSTSYLLGDESSSSKIPVYSCISCGTGTWIDGQPEDFVGVPESMVSQSATYFANPAEGDSMEPIIKNGDYLIFERTPQLDNGKIGSFSLNGNYYCKRLRQYPDGSIWLNSENPSYSPIQVKPEDEFHVLGELKLKLSKM
jgi:repressor LexA